MAGWQIVGSAQAMRTRRSRRWTQPGPVLSCFDLKKSEG